MDCWKGSQELSLNTGFDQAKSYPNGSVLLFNVITSNWEIIEIKYRSRNLETLEDKSLTASVASPKSTKLFDTASRIWDFWCDPTESSKPEEIKHPPLWQLLDKDQGGPISYWKSLAKGRQEQKELNSYWNPIFNRILSKPRFGKSEGHVPFSGCPWCQAGFLTYCFIYL